MKRKAINFAKKVYARLLRFNFVWKNRSRIRRIVRKARQRNLEKFKNQKMRQYDGCTLADTNFEAVTIEKDPDRVAIFGYDVVGQLDGIEKCDYVEYGENLATILMNEDIDVKIGYADDSITDSEALQYLKKTMGLYAVSDKKSYLVTCGDFKVAIIGGSVSRELEGMDDSEALDSITIDEVLMKNIVFAKKENADHIIVYLHREAHKSTVFTPYERAYIRFLANLGADAVFASNREGIHIGGNTMRIDRSFSDTVASMGNLAGIHEEAPGAAMALRFKLVPGKKKAIILQIKGIFLFTMTLRLKNSRM